MAKQNNQAEALKFLKLIGIFFLVSGFGWSFMAFVYHRLDSTFPNVGMDFWLKPDIVVAALLWGLFNTVMGLILFGVLKHRF